MTHGEPLGERQDPDAVEREIGDMEKLLGPLAHEARLFRPNGRGKIGPHLLSVQARDLSHRPSRNRRTVDTHSKGSRRACRCMGGRRAASHD